ncbi:hypothetical protein [Streptomyces sp. NPDC056361]|uniref:hypothetical protein n=1 Tax=Streptomyces sp. NPDC056361 TaxID=3345795 RepID=UPI0035E0FFD1
MEPISAQLLMTLAGAAAGSAGQQLWESLRTLVTRRSHGDGQRAEDAELTGLEEHPDSAERARELANVLRLRAAQDPDFAEALAQVQRQAEGHSGGFWITGGTQHNVIQAENIHGPINLS